MTFPSFPFWFGDILTGSQAEMKRVTSKGPMKVADRMRDSKEQSSNVIVGLSLSGVGIKRAAEIVADELAEPRLGKVALIKHGNAYLFEK